VHLDGVENAIEIMHSMMYARFDGVAIFHTADTAEDAKKVREYLVKFGVKDQEISSRESTNDWSADPREDEKSKVKIVVELPNYDAVVSPATKSPFIYVGKKQQTDMQKHLWILGGKYNFGRRYLSVGIGNYDAAAILAVRMLRRPDLDEGIDEYKAKNADENVLEPRQKLIEEFKEGIR
jgi:hypothetical protein